MIPGMSARPSASIVSRPAPSTSPTAAILPLATARSPRRGGPPNPSRSSASQNTRSYIGGSVYWPAPMLDLRLDGKVAIVTGGTRGIGAATARLVSQQRARVVVLDVATGCVGNH